MMARLGLPKPQATNVASCELRLSPRCYCPACQWQQGLLLLLDRVLTVHAKHDSVQQRKVSVLGQKSRPVGQLVSFSDGVGVVSSMSSHFQEAELVWCNAVAATTAFIHMGVAWAALGLVPTTSQGWPSCLGHVLLLDVAHFAHIRWQRGRGKKQRLHFHSTTPVTPQPHGCAPITREKPFGLAHLAGQLQQASCNCRMMESGSSSSCSHGLHYAKIASFSIIHDVKARLYTAKIRAVTGKASRSSKQFTTSRNRDSIGALKN